MTPTIVPPKSHQHAARYPPYQDAHDRAVAGLSALLDAGNLFEAWQQGRALAFSQAVDLALHDSIQGLDG
jgi:hypothetical protein